SVANTPLRVLFRQFLGSVRIRPRDGLRKQPFFDEYIDELRDFATSTCQSPSGTFERTEATHGPLSHFLTLPSPRPAAHSLSCIVFLSILFFRPSQTGQSIVSSFGFRNFGFTFFLNREASWLGYQLMFILLLLRSHHPSFSHARPADPHLPCLFILNVSASGAYPTSYCVIFGNVIVAGGGLDEGCELVVHSSFI